jgi:LPXTG-motif cell wall-anchored protein
LEPDEKTSNNLIFLILGGAIIFITSIVVLRKRKG